ncbi:TetR/AcrR family transcriptional regulator [Clavibacter michiganensis subsp. tessellarius]|nr:TetR/AcrR family transcriptional regulator [Clavibacter michiganensis]
MAADRVRTRLAPERRRELIIEAAARQVSERGYNSFTLSQLAADCGITRAGIEHHFASKEEVLVAVLRHRDETDEGVMGPAPAGSVTADAAWAALDALVRRNAERREIVRLYAILGAEALDPAHPAHAYFAERAVEARRWIAALASAWHPDPDDFAVEVLAILDGLQLQWLRDPALDLAGLWESVAVTLDRAPR